MSAKQFLFKYLDDFPDRLTFTGHGLMKAALYASGTYHYPATMLRYMREYRDCHDCRIPCVSKKQSRYQMQRSVS